MDDDAFLMRNIQIVVYPWGFSGGSHNKESACIAGDLGSVPELGRSPGERKSYPLQYSALENSMDFFDSVWGHKESDMAE